MENLTLLEVNKPEKLKQTLNELINYKNTLGEIPEITAESIGLGNVDNTRDIDKPLSSAQKSYIDNLCSSKVNAKAFENSEIQYGVVTDVKGDYFTDVSIDEMSLHVNIRSVYTGDIVSETILPLKLASTMSRGLMSKEDVTTLNNLVAKVASMDGRTSRYIYTDSETPTPSEIDAFARTFGNEAPYSGIAVVVDKTYHIWHYYENDGIGWKDDGSDTVTQATNTTLGIVLGSTTDGKISVESDGTMSLVGYDSLLSKVNELQSTTTTRDEVQTMIDESIGSAISTVSTLLGVTDDLEV